MGLFDTIGNAFNSVVGTLKQGAEDVSAIVTQPGTFLTQGINAAINKEASQPLAENIAESIINPAIVGGAALGIGAIAEAPAAVASAIGSAAIAHPITAGALTLGGLTAGGLLISGPNPTASLLNLPSDTIDTGVMIGNAISKPTIAGKIQGLWDTAKAHPGAAAAAVVGTAIAGGELVNTLATFENTRATEKNTSSTNSSDNSSGNPQSISVQPNGTPAGSGVVVNVNNGPQTPVKKSLNTKTTKKKKVIKSKKSKNVKHHTKRSKLGHK